MNIVVVGGGEVGYSLAERLTREDHNVVVIDSDEKAIERAQDHLDVMTLHGSAASMILLQEAGVRTADLLIAVTSSDEMNMICCLIAKRLGTQRTVARIRNPEYEHEMHMLHDELEIDLIMNPERMAAMEISRLLRFPSAMNIETFCRGRVEMIEFKAKEKDPFIGKTLIELGKKYKNSPILFATIIRDGKPFIPDGNTRIFEGDFVYVLGELPCITAFFKNIGRNSENVRDAMIVGAGRIAFYLCRMMENMGMRPRVIERDLEKCEYFNEALPGVLVLNGDGIDQELLDAEGIANMDAFIALTSRDEVNVISSMYAHYCKVPKIITHIGLLSYMSILNNTYMDNCVVSSKGIVADHIMWYVRGLQGGIDSEAIQALYSIGDDDTEAVEFTACTGMRCLNVPLQALRTKKNILVGIIMRGKEIIIPRGNDSIQAGDNVIIISCGWTLHHLDDILAG